MEDNQSHEYDRVALRSPSSKQWEDAKEKIRGLYIEEELPLEAVQARMKERGFVASRRMYKARLASWGFRKYLSKADWQAFAMLQEQRRAAGKPPCQIEMHNRIRSEEDYTRYLRQRNISKATFLAEALVENLTIPDNFRCLDTAAGQSKPAQPLIDPLQVLANHSTSTARQIPVRSQNVDEPGALRFEPHGGPSSAPCQPISNCDSGHDPEPDQVGGDDALSIYLQHITDPTLGVMPVKPSYADLTTVASQPSWLPIEDSIDEYSQFVLRCAFMGNAMMACMSAAAGDILAAGHWVEEASRKLEMMCMNRDPQLLATLNTVLTWVEVHNEGSVGAGLMRSLHEGATKVLGKDDSISVVLKWMTAAAGKELGDCSISTSVLRQAWMNLSVLFGQDHPHAIVASYCLCFHRLKVDDQSFEEVEEVLGELYGKASRAMGRASLQTINILATLSRSQSRQKKYRIALENINRALRETPWGTNHPHRLELLCRKAIICGKLCLWDEREELYWLVVRGRVATLGRHHRSTQKAYDSLVEILKGRGRWESMKGEAQKLLVDPQLALMEYEGWWRREVIREEERKEAESEDSD